MPESVGIYAFRYFFAPFSGQNRGSCDLQFKIIAFFPIEKED